MLLEKYEADEVSLPDDVVCVLLVEDVNHDEASLLEILLLVVLELLLMMAVEGDGVTEEV